MIQTLADTVLRKIKKKCEHADSAGFCLICDGTRGRCNVDSWSVMTRFVSSSRPEKHLIGLLDLHQLNAGYTSEILTYFSDAGNSADYIPSLCYE